MVKQQLTIPQWLDLPFEVRQEFKRIFKLPRSTGSQVVNNEVVCDGHTHKDLAEISVEKMQAFLQSKEEDFWKLFDAALQKLQDDHREKAERELGKAQKEKEELTEQKAEALGELAKQMVTIAENAGEVLAKKRGRPAKVA
jgi:hypothetical protein